YSYNIDKYNELIKILETIINKFYENDLNKLDEDNLNKLNDEIIKERNKKNKITIFDVYNEIVPKIQNLYSKILDKIPCGIMKKFNEDKNKPGQNSIEKFA